MSSFPKNILVKIVKHAIVQDCVTVQNARLVCKAVVNDFEIKNWFKEMRRIMQVWNTLRECARNNYTMGIKTDLAQEGWRRIGRYGRYLMENQIIRTKNCDIEFMLRKKATIYEIIWYVNFKAVAVVMVTNGANLARKRMRE